MMHSAFSISCSVRWFFTPSAPLVSTLMAICISAASAGTSTALLLPWGMAPPPPTPVVPWASRSSTFFSYSTASRRHPVRSSMPTIAWMAMALSATCIFSATRSGTSRSVICIGRLSPFASNILSWGEPEKPKIQPVFTNTTAILFVFRHTPRQGFPLPICSYTRCTASVQRLRNCLRFCLNKRRLRTRAEPPKKFKLLLISSAGSARSQDRTGGSYAYP